MSAPRLSLARIEWDAALYAALESEGDLAHCEALRVAAQSEIAPLLDRAFERGETPLNAAFTALTESEY